MSTENNTAACTNELGELHNTVAHVLAEALKGDPEPAIINAAIKFLKDNNIQAKPGRGGAIDAVADGLIDLDDPNIKEIANYRKK